MGHPEDLMPNMFLTILIGLLAFILSACGKSSFDRDQSKVDQGNRQIARMEEIREELNRENLILPDQSQKSRNQSVEEMKSVIATCDQQKLYRLGALTTEYVQLGESVLKLIDEKAVTYAGDVDELNRRVRAARRLSAEIESEIESI